MCASERGNESIPYPTTYSTKSLISELFLSPKLLQSLRILCLTNNDQLTLDGEELDQIMRKARKW
jgi:hypothetical protein